MPVYLFHPTRSFRSSGSAERPSVFIGAMREICSSNSGVFGTAFLLRRGFGGQVGGQVGESTTDNSDITDPTPPALTVFPALLFLSDRSLPTSGSAERPSVFIGAI
ncbi:MAG: hypothetical protein ACKOTF_14585 [Opitutaceae bacterium]